MLMLWTMVEYLRTCMQSIVKRWRGQHEPLPRSPRSIRPTNKCRHRHSRHKPEWLRQEIIRLKARMPQAGCRTLSDICNRRFAACHGITIGKTCVHNILQRHQYEIQILRKKLKHVTPKPIAQNLIWGLDLTGKVDTHGNLHALLGIIDHGSRALLHLQALHDKTTHTLIEYINQVIRRYGKPKVIRTENEGMFRSPVFSDVLEQLGIRHQRTEPGCPWQNGRIERLFGTLKEKLDQRIYSPRLNAGQAATCQLAGLVDCLVVPSEGMGEKASVREQLNRDLNAFQHWYNHVRPHQNLEGRTPAEAWNGIDPYIKPPKQEQWFEAWNGLLAGYELKY